MPKRPVAMVRNGGSVTIAGITGHDAEMAGHDGPKYAMKIQRGRGTLFPLFSGAGSHVILANLPAHQIKSLYLANSRQISDAALGDSCKEFRNQLGCIRKQGYAEAIGKVNPGMHSVAVPVIGARVVGSLLMLGPASRAQIDAGLAMVPMLQRKATEIGDALRAQEGHSRR